MRRSQHAVDDGRRVVIPLLLACVVTAVEPTATAEPTRVPIQRPTTMDAPAPIQPPIETPPVVEAPPLGAPPPPASATGPAQEPALPLPAIEPLEDAPRPSMRPISAAFRRPGVWVAVGAASFVVATGMRLAIPAVAACDGTCADGADCASVCHPGAVIGLSVGTLPFDALALVASGFAGRSYGLRDGRRTAPDRSRRRRAPFIGAGIACVGAGAALAFAAVLTPLITDRLDPFGYGVAAMRTGGVALGALGSGLLGYGVALPPPTARATAVALRPTIGRAAVGLSLTWHR